MLTKIIEPDQFVSRRAPHYNSAAHFVLNDLGLLSMVTSYFQKPNDDQRLVCKMLSLASARLSSLMRGR